MAVLPFAKPTKRIRDRAYMAAVRQLPCCARRLSACGTGPLGGRPEADHASRNHGANRKGDDTDTIPMCGLHHAHRTNRSGPFKHWTREQMREWCREQIAATRRLVAVSRDVQDALSRDDLGRRGTLHVLPVGEL